MAWRNWGNKATHSATAGPVANPSTATLVAELDSTQLGTVHFATGQSVVAQVTWILGASTNATWQCEVALSTALAAPQDLIVLKTPSAQSGQYVTVHVLEKNARIRARLNSSFTGDATAFISAEVLT